MFVDVDYNNDIIYLRKPRNMTFEYTFECAASSSDKPVDQQKYIHCSIIILSTACAST